MLGKRVEKTEITSILHVDKTGFLRPDHIYEICIRPEHRNRRALKY